MWMSVQYRHGPDEDWRLKIDRCDVKREPTNSFSSWEHDKEKRRALKLFGGCSRLLRMQCSWRNRHFIERSDLIFTVCGDQAKWKIWSTTWNYLNKLHVYEEEKYALYFPIFANQSDIRRRGRWSMKHEAWRMKLMGVWRKKKIERASSNDVICTALRNLYQVRGASSIKI